MILSVRLSVCLHDKTRTAETKIAKLGSEIVHLAHQLILGQKVKGQGHRISKSHDETAVQRRVAALCRRSTRRRRRTAGVSYALYRVPSL